MTMQSGEVIQHTGPIGERETHVLKYSPIMLVVFVFMAVALLYVWSHIHMTQQEYRLAAEIDGREALLDEQRKLRLEYATLKSPQRIEVIAREKLQMSYPMREQVIALKWPEG